jgi:hypothetical protein
MSSSNNQTIEQLTERYKKLNETRIGTERDLKHANEQLSKLKEQAMSTWGTDDIETLQKMLEEMRISNDKKLTDYQKHIEEIETRLKGIEEGELNAEKTK